MRRHYSVITAFVCFIERVRLQSIRGYLSHCTPLLHDHLPESFGGSGILGELQRESHNNDGFDYPLSEGISTSVRRRTCAGEIWRAMGVGMSGLRQEDPWGHCGCVETGREYVEATRAQWLLRVSSMGP